MLKNDSSFDSTLSNLLGMLPTLDWHGKTFLLLALNLYISFFICK